VHENIDLDYDKMFCFWYWWTLVEC